MRIRVRFEERVTSTNALCREAALAGEPPGLWVVGGEQTEGRGRQGRSWYSPPGNFHGSLLLRPQRPQREWASLSLVIGLGVAQTIHGVSEGRIEARLKWPNDVVVGGAKIAGILLEGGGEGRDAPGFVIAGIGVNLGPVPGDAGYEVTSLTALGSPAMAPLDFLDHLSPRLTALFGLWEEAGFAGLRDTWLAAAHGRDGEVGVRVGEERISGRLLDVDAQGALRLLLRDGTIRHFEAGELFFP